MRVCHSFLSLIFCLLLFTGGTAAEYKTLPAEYDGSMMPYDFSRVDSLPVIPEGYEPVYVSYVARHGARYLSSPKKVEKIKKALDKGAEEDALSPSGAGFLDYLNELVKRTEGRWGLLSEVGLKEESRLGKQMAEMLPELFTAGRVETVSTFVPRVVMTMYEFNHALERRHEKIELYTSSGVQNDSLLYFFDAFKGYSDFRNSGAWKAVYDDFVMKHVSAEPARRLFSKGKRSEADLKKLTMEMYGVVQGNRAAGFEPPTTQWFSEEEYRQCYLASNLVHYLRNTPNSLDPYCAPAVRMLIDRITDDADRALANNGKEGKPTVMNGYFGHAETLLPLLAVMNVPGCYVPATTYENLDSRWRLQEITPLGANLMMIFLRKGDEIYVSVRHNGRNVEAYPGAGEIVSWKALKDYWQNRLRAFSRPKARLL